MQVKVWKPLKSHFHTSRYSDVIPLHYPLTNVTYLKVRPADAWEESLLLFGNQSQKAFSIRVWSIIYNFHFNKEHDLFMQCNWFHLMQQLEPIR